MNYTETVRMSKKEADKFFSKLVFDVALADAERGFKFIPYYALWNFARAKRPEIAAEFIDVTERISFCEWCEKNYPDFVKYFEGWIAEMW